jgi:hypothetical protein
MKQVVDGGAELLYTDTGCFLYVYMYKIYVIDSIIYRFRTASGDPVQCGAVLGTMADEYPQHDILEFIAAGNKVRHTYIDNNNKSTYICT